MLNSSMMEAAADILVIERPPTSSKQQGACGHVTADDGGSRQSFLIGTGTAQDAEDCCRQPFHPSMVRLTSCTSIEQIVPGTPQGIALARKHQLQQWAPSAHATCVKHRLPVYPVQVASGLSQLGRSASGSHQVYQTLKITHTDLQDPQAVAHCRHIQQLLLPGNCLTSLQPLSSLQHLTSIDVSHNRLTQVRLQVWQHGVRTHVWHGQVLGQQRVATGHAPTAAGAAIEIQIWSQAMLGWRQVADTARVWTAEQWRRLDCQ